MVAAAFVAVCAVFSPAPLLAQGDASVNLQVTDGETGAPLPGATVRVDGVVRAVSDTAGRVLILGLEPGRHLLDVTMLGRRPVAPEIEIAGGQALALEVVLETEDVPLPVVEASAPPGGATVNHGPRRYGGRWIGRDDLEHTTTNRLGELLIRLGALQPNGHLRQARCGPKVVADGIMLGDTELDIFPVQDVEAVEIFSIGGVPPEYGGSLAGVCGVVAVWTRHK
ncbi:Carboxypeptidase regulatory-like domain-containing protein [bacterium JGI 053]|nr:Carboxypeptidase regulatory-like domain-containing protein [bacterium JGI 053]